MNEDEYLKLIKKQIRNWCLIGIAGTILYIITCISVYYRIGWFQLQLLLLFIQLITIGIALRYFLKNRKLIVRLHNES
jgi:hypothetical protein